MLYEVSGDILLTKASAIAHGVAPNDDFKKGLAHSLRERWPAMYKDFRHFCQTRHPKSGSLWTWKAAGSRTIINLFTQDGSFDHGGKPGKASVSHVHHAIKELRKEIEKEGIPSIALPKLATGVGGLDWEEVKPEIEKELGGLNIPVIIYSEFHAGQQAEEPGVEE